MTGSGWLLLVLLGLTGVDDSHKVELAFDTRAGCEAAASRVSAENDTSVRVRAHAFCIPLPPMDGGTTAQGD